MTCRSNVIFTNSGLAVRYLDVSNVDQRRLTSGNILSVKSKSGVIENGTWWQPLESRCNQLLFKSYFQFRFGGRHLGSVVNVVVKNMGVAVGIMSVCRWKLKLHRPAGKLRFSHEGCPWFSRSLQVLK